MSDATFEPPSLPAGDAGPLEAQAAPLVREHWTQTLRARLVAALPERAGLSRLAFAVTIPVFFWVFYTTSSGMIDIMRRDGDDFIGLIGTFIGASAVLVMLTATSWSLGADLGALIARRQFFGERIVLKTCITLGVFLFVFSISAFFSFTYYYNNIFRLSSRKIVSELQPMELAADVLLPAGKLIAQNYDAGVERLFNSGPVRAHLEAMDAIAAAAAGAGGPRLRDNLRKAEEEAQRAAAAVARKNAEDLQRAQATGREIAEARQKIAALEQTIAGLEPIIKSKQDEAATVAATLRQEEQLATDAAKGLDNLGASCGPNCAAHRAKAAAARKRLDALKETLAGPTNERAAAIHQRDTLEAQLITLRQQEESALARSGAAPSAPSEQPMDLAATLRALAKARDDIRANPTLASFRAAKPICQLLLAAERQSNAAPPQIPADFSCDPDADEMRAIFAERDGLIAGRAAFEKKCSLDGELHEELQAITLRVRNAPEGDKSAAATGIAEAKRLVDGCVVAGKAAGLSEADVQMLLKRSDAFLRGHSMERNRFELAREAFLSMTPDATMALGVAVAQDAFMLVMKLLSELMKHEVKAKERRPLPSLMDLTDVEEDDCDTRVVKTLLRGAKPFHGGTSSFDARAAVRDLPEQVRNNLNGLLNRLVRHGIAYVDRKGVYVMDDESLIEAEARLETLLKRQRMRLSTAGALSGSRDGPPWGDEPADGAGPRRPRGFGGLERYLSPRFLAPDVDMSEQGSETATL
ncbi:MAG TPA: hypothetical protein VED87_02410 [Methylocystis sp.]|nr:hypothetical protein [Methylocystis sp.]